MNKAEVQEIYNRLNKPRNISAIEALGLKPCLYFTCCDVWESPTWLYLGGNDVTVRNTNGQDDALEDAASALRALQDTLQKDVFSKIETALESLSEAKKD